MSGARATLWAASASLSQALGPDLSPRARRLAAQAEPAIGFDDLRAAPSWARAEPAERRGLARLTGAAATASGWRRTIDGGALRGAAEAIGEAALDALLALPDVFAGKAADPRALKGDAMALERLGGRLMLAAADGPAATQGRLRRLLALAPGDAAWPDEPTAASAVRTTQALLAQLEARKEETA